MTTTTPLTTIQDSASVALRKAAKTTDSERTNHLRETARHFVDAREHFFDREGMPDWKGRTYAYRQWVQEAMAKAGVPPEEVPTISAAVRYHTGNILRERLDPETLEDLGLRKASPRERSVEKRERHMETLSLFGAGAELTEPDPIRTALTMIDTVLRRVSLEAVRTMHDDDREAIATAFAALHASGAAIIDAAGEAPELKK